MPQADITLIAIKYKYKQKDAQTLHIFKNFFRLKKKKKIPKLLTSNVCATIYQEIFGPTFPMFHLYIMPQLTFATL